MRRVKFSLAVSFTMLGKMKDHRDIVGGAAVKGNSGCRSSVEGGVGEPAGAVLGLGLVEFKGAEVGGFACEVVVDCREHLGGVDGFGVGFQTEVQVGGVIDLVALVDVGGHELFEDVEVEFDAVGFLAGSLLEVGEGGEVAPFGAGDQPLVLLRYAFVGAESVVVRAVVRGAIGPDHDGAVGRVAAEEEIIAEVGIGVRILGILFAD